MDKVSGKLTVFFEEPKMVQGFWLYIECIVLKIMEYIYRIHKA